MASPQKPLEKALKCFVKMIVLTMVRLARERGRDSLSRLRCSLARIALAWFASLAQMESLLADYNP